MSGHEGVQNVSQASHCMTFQGHDRIVVGDMPGLSHECLTQGRCCNSVLLARNEVLTADLHCYFESAHLPLL